MEELVVKNKGKCLWLSENKKAPPMISVTNSTKVANFQEDSKNWGKFSFLLLMIFLSCWKTIIALNFYVLFKSFLMVEATLELYW